MSFNVSSKGVVPLLSDCICSVKYTFPALKSPRITVAVGECRCDWWTASEKLFMKSCNLLAV